jgi:hypothetical protein
MMASKLNADEAANLIEGFGHGLVFYGCHPAITDPAVGGAYETEFFLQLDKPTQNTLLAAKLEGQAAVYKAVAEANEKIAGILKTRG